MHFFVAQLFPIAIFTENYVRHDEYNTMQYKTFITRTRSSRTSNLMRGQSLGGRGCGALVNWEEM